MSLFLYRNAAMMGIPKPDDRRHPRARQSPPAGQSGSLTQSETSAGAPEPESGAGVRSGGVSRWQAAEERTAQEAGERRDV